MVSTEVCGASSPGSNPGRHPSSNLIKILFAGSGLSVDRRCPLCFAPYFGWEFDPETALCMKISTFAKGSKKRYNKAMKWLYAGILVIGGAVLGNGVAFFLSANPAFSTVTARAFTKVESVFSNDQGYAAVIGSENETAMSDKILGLGDDAAVKESAIGVSSAAASSSRSIKIPVLVYHSVRPYTKGESKKQDTYDITPELLESELAYVKDNGYTTITFADVTAYFNHGTPLPQKPVILSFDDGWKNQYEYAFPLLKRYGMKGTFFIFTNPIDHEKPHWMSWGEVKELDAAGMEIAGHSRTHPFLTKISTNAELDKEILGGKQIIEQHLGHSISSFAYPFGASNEHVVAAVKHAGYTLARTLSSGVWNDPEHVYEFHGVLANDNLSDFVKVLMED